VVSGFAVMCAWGGGDFGACVVTAGRFIVTLGACAEVMVVWREAGADMAVLRARFDGGACSLL